MGEKELLKKEVKHFDIKKINSIPLVEEYADMSFQARNLARGSRIYEAMLNDKDCAVILCLAGSLFSAGLKKVVYDLVREGMVDVIVSTGAVIVDQDFFEALGFKHYAGCIYADDGELMEKRIDRIYDTYINEDELRICDETVRKVADAMEEGVYSSREFIKSMGEYLKDNNIGEDSVIRAAYEKGVPIFVPAFSDCSAGFGLVEHQYKRKDKGKVAIDSVKDFLELTRIKLVCAHTGLLMIGGGVPKNFAQDITVSADILQPGADMHKYAVQITVADERDGGLSGSTLKEAHSWGKVDEGMEQMIYSEATLTFPLLASYAYHRGAGKGRKDRNFNLFLEENNE